MSTGFFESDNSANNGLFISEEVSKSFISSSRWCIFISIMGFLFTALMLFVGIAMFLMSSVLESAATVNPNPVVGMIMPYMGIMYIIIAIIYFLPSLFLLQYATNIRKGIDNGNQVLFSAAINKLKITFTTIGIIIITTITLIIVGYGFIIAKIVSAGM